MTNSPASVVRVAVIGAGRMGADHVERITSRIRGARVSAVVDIDAGRAEGAARAAEGAIVFTSLDELIDAGLADAVLLATPGFLHEEALLALIRAELPVLCEKPLTPDPESSMRIVEAEAALGRKLIQVGFMRRFDAGYRRLRHLITSGEYGELLMLHHQHRNAEAPLTFTDEMIIHDSVVHEFDAVRFFTGEELSNVLVRSGRITSQDGRKLPDPQLVTVQTESGLLADIEIFVQAQVGYQVHTQATFERGIVKIGEEALTEVTVNQVSGRQIDASFHTRFFDAYDVEVQQWVDSVRSGTVVGSDAWDGYAAAAACAAGVESQKEGRLVEVSLAPQPNLYQSLPAAGESLS